MCSKIVNKKISHQWNSLARWNIEKKFFFSRKLRLHLERSTLIHCWTAKLYHSISLVQRCTGNKQRGGGGLGEGFFLTRRFAAGKSMLGTKIYFIYGVTKEKTIVQAFRWIFFSPFLLLFLANHFRMIDKALDSSVSRCWMSRYPSWTVTVMTVHVRNFYPSPLPLAKFSSKCNPIVC